MLLFVKQLLFLSPSGISVEFYMLYYPNFFIDFLIIFPIVRVTHLVTADFFSFYSFYTKCSIKPINQSTSSKEVRNCNQYYYFYSWKKYVLSQKKGMQKIFSVFSSNFFFFCKKLVSKSYLHIEIFENVVW